MKGTHKGSLLLDCSLQKLSNRRKIHKLLLLYKIVKGSAPIYLSDMCSFYVSQRTPYGLWTRNDLCLPFIRTEKLKSSFLFSASSLCNSLSESSRESVSIASFKNYLLRETFYKYLLLINWFTLAPDIFLSYILDLN